MSKNIRRKIITTLLWSIMTVLLVSSFLNISEMRRFSEISLRYDEPISGQQAYQLRRFSIERDEETVFWPTFWHETKARFDSDYRTVSAACIFFSGDASLVWHADYITGAAPGVTDSIGCTISSELAHAIWGSHDVVGKSLKIDGEERTVRGVFEGEQHLALISFKDEDTSQSFTAIELTGGLASPTRSDVENFILSAGLAMPDIILTGRPTLLATAMAILPQLVFAIFLIIIFVIKQCKRPVLLNILVFTALLVFALTLPILLELLPQWMIPSRFSDFSFWSTLSTQLTTDLQEYLKLTPHLRDVTYALLFYKQAAISFAATILALILICRHVCHTQPVFFSNYCNPLYVSPMRRLPVNHLRLTGKN